MRKNIIIATVIVLLGAVAWFMRPSKFVESPVLSSTTTPAKTDEPTSGVNQTKQSAKTASSTGELISLSFKSDPDDVMIKPLQEIWDSYLSALKTRDVPKVASLSFQLSPNCANLDKYQKECFQAIDDALKAFENIKTSDFTVVWYDNRQAILMTKPRAATYEGSPGFYQPRIFFGVKDGVYKVLAVFPEWGRFANKDKVPAAEVQSFLQKGMLDSDKDGLTDMEENCDNGAGPGSIGGCKQTDPNVRDENRNGWWDGVEAYIRPIQN